MGDKASDGRGRAKQRARGGEYTSGAVAGSVRLRASDAKRGKKRGAVKRSDPGLSETALRILACDPFLGS